MLPEIPPARRPGNPVPPPADAEILSRAQAFVRARCAQDSGGHDFHPLRRVHALALRLAPSLGADPFGTAMAAWLHDVAPLPPIARYPPL